MAWRSRRSLITGGTLGQVVQRSFRSAGSVLPSGRGLDCTVSWGPFQPVRFTRERWGHTASSGVALSRSRSQGSWSPGRSGRGSAWPPQTSESSRSWAAVQALPAFVYSHGQGCSAFSLRKLSAQPLSKKAWKVSFSGFLCYLRNLQIRAGVPKVVSSGATGFSVQDGHCLNISYV